ncbi:uncharacterized protein LOC126318209 isoform X1 [Schistocerca gregaria]|uniref:uncharacterized protein LOC126318209 isoform X1 n=1 Tax=Schistocerca gregaria TaxID=7010 RepID=UPI00211E9BA2|nr:uncharacterized protein LOC126318209 isoform X1 [Schistocerca gregaria]XP_049849184.1 uncharacterized protein LOC126318209 isoform X1 [Schistocerca gregaria]
MQADKRRNARKLASLNGDEGKIDQARSGAESKPISFSSIHRRCKTNGSLNCYRAGASMLSRDCGRDLDEHSRVQRFESLLHRENVDMHALRVLSWNGIPEKYRGLVWRMLLEYCPPNALRREVVLSKKREEYREFCLRYYVNMSTNTLRQDWLESASYHDKIFVHQIKIDVPRTLPHNSLFSDLRIQGALERVLTLWSLRHPASGYVQGINDLVTPFFIVFLREFTIKNEKKDDQDKECYLEEEDKCISPAVQSSCTEKEECCTRSTPKKNENLDIDFSLISDQDLAIIEADVYWSMSMFIQSIQDNYIFAQPGIRRMLKDLEKLVSRIDAPLFVHLQAEGINFVQFAFRWMNCLLMRELPMSIVIRLWDTYISEGRQFSSLHTYFCASLLISFSKELRESDFQNLMMFLHHLPTEDWTIESIEPLISQAYMWQTYYNNSPSHLKTL